MAKLPSAVDLGVTPSLQGSAPVGNFDAAAGAMSRVAAGQRQSAQNLGRGLGELGNAVADVGLEKARYEYATAHAQALSQLTDLHARMANDPDYSTMSDRYDKAATEIYNNAAERISLPSLRTRFVELSAPDVAKTKAAAVGQAQKLEGDANTTYVQEQGDKFINQGSQNPHDTALTRKLVDGYGALVDGLQGRGFITQEQSLRMKQDWAHKYALADGVERSKTDPTGVINDLRAAPQSVDQIDNRIVQIESNGNPTARSKSSSAYGAGQFVDDTWLPLMRKYHPELADKSDAEVLALRADSRLSREMVGRYREENTATLAKQGIEPSGGNLYLAHFLGPGAAAAVLKSNPNMPIEDALKSSVGPEKAAKMIAANGDILRGQTAGSVAQWANDKMGGVGPGGGHIYDLLRPDQRAMLLSHAEASLQKRTTEDSVDFKGKVADSVSEAMRTGSVEQPLTLEDFVARHGPQDGPAAYDSYKAQLRLGADIQRLQGMSYEQMEELRKSYEPMPGEGYADAAKRADVLGKAITAARAKLAKDPEFQQQYENSVAEARRTGASAAAIGKAEFERRFGKEEGGRLYGAYRSDLRLGGDLSRAGELSPQEQHALVGGYDPELQAKMFGAEYTDALKRQGEVGKAIAQLTKERDKDPAAYAIARLPAVTDAWKNFAAVLSNPGAKIEDKQAAARTYAETAGAEQARIGVPADKRKLLPQDYVDRFGAMLAKPQAAGGTLPVAAAIENEAKIWGDAWPQAYRQLSKGAQPSVVVIGSGVKPIAAQVLTEFANTKLGDIANDQSTEKLGTIKKDVRDAFKPLQGSMTAQEGTQPVIDAFQSAGEKLAAWYVRGGKSSSDAAKQAFDDLLGHKYDFSAGTYRVPKDAGVTPADVAQGLEAARARLTQSAAPLASQLDAADRALKLTPQERALYQRHLTNLTGSGGVDNPDGSRSTLFQASVEIEGRTYNIPTVWDGKILKPEDALKRAEREGFDKFPSYASSEEAETRYGKMHDFMERDTAAFLEGRRARGPFDLAPARDTVGGLSPEYLKRETARAYARDGVWVTSPDEKGLVLTYKDQAVRRADGTPLLLTWPQLGAMANDRHEAAKRELLGAAPAARPGEFIP